MLSRSLAARALPGFLAAILLGSTQALASDVSGEWTLVIRFGEEEADYHLELKQTGEKVEGVMVSPRSQNRYPVVKGLFKDSALKMDIDHGGQTWQVAAKLEGDGRKLGGTILVEGFDAAVTITRKGAPPRPKGPALAGRWRTRAKLPDDREVSSLLEVVEREGKLSARATSERGTRDFQSVSAGDDGSVTLVIVFETDSGDREIRIHARFEGPDELKGRWSSASGEHSGEWSARREAAPAPAPGARLAGRYHVRATVPDGGTVDVEFRFKIEGDQVTGQVINPEGVAGRIVRGTFSAGRVEFEAEVPDDSGDLKHVKVSGTVGERGILRATWVSGDASGDLVGREAVDL